MLKIVILSLVLAPLVSSSITRKEQIRLYVEHHQNTQLKREDPANLMFSCFNGEETHQGFICDGDNDCGDCSDELAEGCTIPCVLGQWRADTGCQDANDVSGILYNGSISITETGKQCQAWSSQEPHSHTRGETGDEAILAYWKNLGQTPAEAGNSCRNPDGEPGPWCYTTEPDTRWELCKIPTCATNTDNTRTSQSKKSSRVELKKRSEFSCSNGEMTLTDFICDGDNDCGDCSDELAEGCTIPCVLGQWRADTGNTTGTIGEDQYFGYSDFQCANGEVTSSSYICDGDNDCGDCSDEPAENCTVPCVPGLWRHDDFQCHNNMSVSSLYVCDGDNDCDDCSDERQAGCDNPCVEGQWNADAALSKKQHRRESLSKKKHSLVRKNNVKRSEFSCSNGGMTMSSYVCDGDNDCGDCSDELQPGCTEPCVPGLWRHDDFQCSNGESTSRQFICDGDNDCGDCSDERANNCTEPCVEGQWNVDDTQATSNDTAAENYLNFECTNGQLTSSEFVCDGDNDCSDCSDERQAGCDKPCVEGQWNAPPPTTAAPTLDAQKREVLEKLEYLLKKRRNSNSQVELKKLKKRSDFACSNGELTFSDYICDGDNDCGDCSDELAEGCNKPCVLGQWRADTGCQDANDSTGIVFNGTVSVTETGKPCQAWSSQEPHSHTRGETGDEAILAYWKNLGQTPAEAGNSCRNPDGEPGPWCYTTEPDTRWELCKIPTCATNTGSVLTVQKRLRGRFG